jgi:putative aldouronate transport system substrate-binding protein
MSETPLPAYVCERRTLLAGAGAAALLLTGTLAACSRSDTPPVDNTPDKNARVQLPTYRPFTGVRPDLPATPDGVDPAFKAYPRDGPRSVRRKPGHGADKVSAMANVDYPLPPGADKNPWWQGLNERMGVDLSMTMVSTADYRQRYATTIAGDDLPDLLQMQVVEDFPQLLKSKFTDLSEFLSGDAILDYPNLANVPTLTWTSSVYNGAIYGVPIPRGRVGHYVFIRRDLFDRVGAATNPGSYEELLDSAKLLSDPLKRRWAFATPGSVNAILSTMNLVPNNWSLDGGKLTKDVETSEWKQTVIDQIAFWRAGVIHPDGFNPAQPHKALFNSGMTAINDDEYGAWTQYILDNPANPAFKLGLMTVPKRDGGRAPWRTGSGIYSITGMSKQDSPERVKLLLRTLDWLAAPFGSREAFYRLFGEQGRDNLVDDHGNATLTPEGALHTRVPIRYVADAPQVLYQPGRPGDAVVQHRYQQAVLRRAVTDPTLGLWSNVAATQGARLEAELTDTVNQVIQGRQPVSALDDAVKKWKSGGGDKIRGELEAQLAGGTATPTPEG